MSNKQIVFVRWLITPRDVYRSFTNQLNDNNELVTYNGVKGEVIEAYFNDWKYHQEHNFKLWELAEVVHASPSPSPVYTPSPNLHDYYGKLSYHYDAMFNTFDDTRPGR